MVGFAAYTMPAQVISGLQSPVRIRAMPTGPVRTNPFVLQAVSRADPLWLLNGNFTLKLNGSQESSLVDGGCLSSMVIPDNARLPSEGTVGLLRRLRSSENQFPVRLRYHTTRANGYSPVISGG